MSTDEVGGRSREKYTLPYEGAADFFPQAVLKLGSEGGRGGEAGPPEHGIEGLDWSEGGRSVEW